MDIHISRNGQQFGPCSLDAVNQQLTAGTLQSSDLAWHEGMLEWRPLSAISGAASARTVPPRPPPPPTTPASSSTAAKGIIAAGYICAVVSLLLFPPGFGIAGLVLGIVALTKGSIGHGIAIIVLSVTLGILGFCIGFAMNS